MQYLSTVSSQQEGPRFESACQLRPHYVEFACSPCACTEFSPGILASFCGPKLCMLGKLVILG